jgi:hypothetical protein
VTAISASATDLPLIRLDGGRSSSAASPTHCGPVTRGPAECASSDAS